MGGTDAGKAPGEGDQTITTAPADVQGGNHLAPRGPGKTEVWKAVKGRCSQCEHPVESGNASIYTDVSSHEQLWSPPRQGHSMSLPNSLSNTYPCHRLAA